MELKTLEPNPAWAAGAYEETVDTLEAFDDLVYKVWGGDWCSDCRSQLPDFGAALDAAEVPAERIEHYEVDAEKNGPGVDEYGIEFIPTVVVEQNGEELCRFVESENVPIAVFVAEKAQAELGMPE
ncbi:thioredoxin domain-containing protein [Halovenus rubra]|uniref:Thioredoxin domain-containing protein n=2 Tax=Halovenus rubra TaxID=869890 RepID=A0ABD5X6B9_9EURY|nr:thioredoxin family protein [Halovenus rubra]